MKSLWLVAGLLLSGCVTSGYVEAEAPPPAIETYPYTYYDGHVVYWVGDRWYARRGSSWVYYRSEPAYLRQYRGHYRYYARPSPGYYRRTPYYAPRRAAPPVRRVAPPARRFAPPARRVAPPARRR